ncbi:redoxin domain-containing protein [Adhaeribacter swui]|uniref:Redoxin domain-containing protein n=1 Tax=Adhaeribacter swui TaxID=2086471 RepID=A0A7G7GDA7_9BACT|nr:redoxin domain-containing protein [Adhaeribacter swui]QNF35141.1 redoxin domain-containing protein [Adhaeribacter swui]
MNKKVLLIIIVIAGIVGWMFVSRKQTVLEEDTNTPVQASAPLALQNDLPNLPLLKPDQTKLSTKELKGKTIIIFFEPDCEHCQREANEMQKHLPAFANYNVYFVSPAPMDQMQQFFMKYNLSGPNISYAQTPNSNILQEFGAIPAPSIFIYSEQGKLVKAFKGETPMDNILPLL